MRALYEVLSFQLQLDGCKHEVMIAASTWVRTFVCFVYAGLEALGCPDEVYLVVYLPIRGTGCCPRQLVGMESAGKGESVALCKL